VQPNEPLARLEREMRMPPQRRLELLEELDSDLDAFARELVSNGWKPRRARQVALSRLLPSGEALEHLEAEYEPIGVRWLRQRRWLAYADRCALVLSAGVPVVLALWVLQKGGGVATSSFWVVAELLIIAALGINWTRAASRLWVRRDLRPAMRLAYWRLHAGLIVAAVAIGALGSAWEGYMLLGAGSGLTTVPIWSSLRSVLTLATLGTAAAVFGLFGWLSLMPRLATDDVIQRRIAAIFRRSSTTHAATRR